MVTCKNEESKMEELECSQDFPHYNLWELSVAMETRVLIRSGTKPYAGNLISISLLDIQV